MIQFLVNGWTDGRMEGGMEGRADPILKDPYGYHQSPKRYDLKCHVKYVFINYNPRIHFHQPLTSTRSKG